VNPVYVALAKECLKGSKCLVVTVVGFPLGASLTETKVKETEEVIALGADEIDMVIDIGALKGGDNERVYQDIASVVKAAGSNPVKVILEMSLLNEEEKSSYFKRCLKICLLPYWNLLKPLLFLGSFCWPVYPYQNSFF